jgi:stearoyl-CoA desaturase (delta-9 desaturase)
MLAITDRHVADKFVIKYTPDSKGKSFDLIFVDSGFFDLIVMPMIPLMIFGHVVHIYGLYLIFVQQHWMLLITMSMFLLWAGFGVTGGSHRLWCHRSYEASTAFRIFLMIGQTMSGQYTIKRWSAGHRAHHKNSDTDADPHNVKRGFCFSHLGWMVKKEHPWVDIRARSVDVSDIDADPVAKFQENYYNLIFFVFSFLIPVVTPMLLFNESFINSFVVCFVMRIVNQTHMTALVNSAAHMFGDRPYSPRIASVENSFISFGAIGEGYHNYHHVYPYDYGAGEVGNFFNPTKLLIDIMNLFGQTFKLKQASKEVVNRSKLSGKEILDEKRENHNNNIASY